MFEDSVWRAWPSSVIRIEDSRRAGMAISGVISGGQRFFAPTSGFTAASNICR
jgi:hypothetical protein